MLLGIALVLVVLWLLGFIAIPIGGSLIHLLLIIAIIVVIFHFMQRRRA